MDLDAELKRLNKWKKDVEELLTPRVLTALLAVAASEQTGDIGDHVTAVQQAVDGFDSRLKALESAKPADGGDADRLTALETKLASLQAPDLSAIETRLTAIEGPMKVLADPAMIDLLNWLASEQESLKVLLSVGDDAQTDTTAGTASAGAGTVAGAANQAPPVDGAGTTQAAPAAPTPPAG